MSKAAEHKWAGELSAMAFILENLLASAFVSDGPEAAKAFRDGILQQWNNGAVKTPEGMSPFDASLIHQAGKTRIESIFTGVVERIQQQK